ncbi:MAG: hypothetical protein ACM3MH_11115 [Actinomycetota bacterium]
MSDRVKLAREIAARTKPRFIDTNPKRPQTVEECEAIARAIAASSEPRFIHIPRERGGGKVHYTEEQLMASRGGLTAEEYRWKLIREWRKRS